MISREWEARCYSSEAVKAMLRSTDLKDLK